MNHRLAIVRSFLQKHNIDAVFISSSANITYLTSFPFLVETDREAFVLVTKKHHYIISSPLYKDEILKTAPDFSFIEFVDDHKKVFWDVLKEIIETEHITTLGFEEDNLTVLEYRKLQKYHKRLKGLLLEDIRAKKDAQEIAAIKKACTITDQAFSYILQKIKPGMTEKEVALQIDNFIRKAGADPSFTTIIAFGANAAVPHHQTGNQKVNKRDLILMDFGVKVDNYCSDMTRTVFLGKPTSHQRHVYETVLASQQAALDYLQQHKLPIPADRPDTIARESIAKQNFPVFSHTLGHSIGINVHDGFRLAPKSPTGLTNGMVFSVEPGIYLSGEFGVRIEDTVAILDHKLCVLTSSPKELIVL